MILKLRVPAHGLRKIQLKLKLYLGSNITPHASKSGPDQAMIEEG